MEMFLFGDHKINTFSKLCTKTSTGSSEKDLVIL